MTFNKNHLMIGAAAIVLAGAGVAAGAVFFSGDRDHSGETAEQHAAELGGAHNEADGHDHDEQEAGHDEEGHAHEGEEGGEGHVEGEVEIDEDRIRAAGITVIEVASGALDVEIVAQATVRAAPDGEAVLTARASGSIADIRKRLGDPVKRGETVAIVLSPEAAALSAARSSAKAQLDLAQANFEREKTLFESRVSARQDFDAAQAALNQARSEYERSNAAAQAARVTNDGRSVAIASQIDGRITAVTEAARLGAYVAPETVLFRIADPAKVQIEAVVPSIDVARIKPGDPATVEGGGAAYAATVQAVTPGVDIASRGATVVLTLSEQAPIHPGQFARVLIRPASQTSSERFVLPEEAVQSVEGREVVFVRTDHGFVATPVQTGQRSGGRIEIVQGLSAGQTVARTRAFVLKAELGKGEAGHDH